MLKKQHIHCIFWLLIISVSFVTVVVARTHQLTMDPVRSVFTDKKRVATVKIFNPTDHTLSYSISTLSMRKDSDGNLVEVEKESEEEMLLRKMIRFSPRRATIEPGKRQLVKMMLRNPRELPQGEYLLWLQLVPLDLPVDTPAGKAENESSAAMQLNIDIVVKSNFPIFIQNGKISSQVVPYSIQIQSVDNTDERMFADIILHREGNGTAFGSVYVTYIPANSNESKRIGIASEVAVYLSDNTKRLPVRLRNISAAELNTGELEVTFQPMIEDGTGKKYGQTPSTSKRFSLPLP